MLSFNRAVECPRRDVELVASARVAEADDLASVGGEAVGADRLARPRAGLVDRVLDAAREVQVRLGPGDTIAIPPETLHSFRVVGDAPMRLLGTHVSPRRIVNYADGYGFTYGARVSFIARCFGPV